MPYGEDSTCDAAGRREVHEGKRGGKAGILHADLDRHRTYLRFCHACFLSRKVSECHAAKVVEDDDAEDDEAAVKNRTAGKGYDASYGEDDDESREHRSDLRDFRDGLREENIEKDA